MLSPAHSKTNLSHSFSVSKEFVYTIYVGENTVEGIELKVNFQ
jgi:hypothetical protein